MQVKRRQTRRQRSEDLQQQIEELKSTNLQLQTQLARQQKYIAMIAHEMGGPLTPILNYAKIIARQDQLPDSVTRGTTIIISQAQRLKRLVRDLQDEARLSTGQFTLTRIPCDLAKLTREVVEQLRPTAPYHRFELDIPAEPVQGNWDGERLQQALGNLLDNAIKYSDDASTITVRLSTTEKLAYISVHNQGKSIAPQEVGRLFQPFVRLPETAGRHGSGLGLYITKCIIEAHGGTLWLESASDEEQGTGNTFTFDLPL